MSALHLLFAAIAVEAVPPTPIAHDRPRAEIRSARFEVLDDRREPRWTLDARIAPISSARTGMVVDARPKLGNASCEVAGDGLFANGFEG